GGTPMDLAPHLGNEVTFTYDPDATGPQVTALDDGSFILAWEDGRDIFAKRLNKQGQGIVTSKNFLAIVSSDTWKPLSRPRVFQQSDGRVIVTYRLLNGPVVAEHDVLWHRVNTDFTPDDNPSYPIEDFALDEVLMDSTARIGEDGGAIVFERPQVEGD